MKIHVDKIYYKHKPTQTEISQIKYRFTQADSIQDLSAKQIAQLLCKGHTIQPGVTPFSDTSSSKGTTAKDWSEQTLFMVDIDNEHADIPAETPEHVEAFLKDYAIVPAFAYPSFSSTQKKERFRFAIVSEEPITDPDERLKIQKALGNAFPQADQKCYNADRMFFGTDKGLYPDIGDFNAVCKKEHLLAFADHFYSHAYEDKSLKFGETIPSGQRHATLVSFASKVLTKYGDSDEAYELYMKRVAQCEEPKPDEEVQRIWKDARSYWEHHIKNNPDYIPPEVYNNPLPYKPVDYSDVGQAEVLEKYFFYELRYSPATKYICYTGSYWQESEPGAQAVAHELTRRQMEEANRNMDNVMERMRENNIFNILQGVSKSKINQVLNSEQLVTYDEFMDAKAYKEYVIKRRDSKNISSTLKEARPMLEISLQELDADCFALCTPKATYDLRKGMAGAREHNPEDFITKITSVSPSRKGQQLWLDSLDLIFQKDQELIDYVQMICGLAAIGKVYVEALIIAYGDGRNGKSTFWNTISRVLGLYSGNISADTLTVGCHRNIKPEMAEIKGKRLLIAAEMQEGARLNDSTVKQLCSTDDIFAEKKYKDPFSFKPCHTLVLYTNHLPRVGATDDGVWRRLIVIPFTAKISGSNDIKNYSEYLYDNAGESVLAWIIEGAKKVIDNNYQIPVPNCVQESIQNYREQNDWFGYFLEEKCDVGDEYIESSALLYSAYKNHCTENNEYTRSTQDFYFALENAGFERVTLKRKRYFKGVRLIPGLVMNTRKVAEDDFLS